MILKLNCLYHFEETGVSSLFKQVINYIIIIIIFNILFEYILTKIENI